MHLRFDHHGAADGAGLLFGLFRGGGHRAVLGRDSGRSEQFFGLILVNFHQGFPDAREAPKTAQADSPDLCTFPRLTAPAFAANVMP